MFLDRDGVLNAAHVRHGRPFPPASVSETRLLPGAAEACQELRTAGLTLIGVTNQPDIARGLATPADVAAINDYVADACGLDDMRVCPHDDADRCNCRKPLPGMLLGAAEDHGIELAASVMIGDRWRDIEAGKSAGCRTVFIDHNYDERRPQGADFVCAGLAQAVPWITGETASP